MTGNKLVIRLIWVVLLLTAITIVITAIAYKPAWGISHTLTWPSAGDSLQYLIRCTTADGITTETVVDTCYWKHIVIPYRQYTYQIWAFDQTDTIQYYPPRSAFNLGTDSTSIILESGDTRCFLRFDQLYSITFYDDSLYWSFDIKYQGPDSLQAMWPIVPKVKVIP